MIRIACGLAILAIIALLGMVLQTSGGTATLYAFIGIPSLALAILVYLAAEGGHVRRQIVRWLGGSALLLGALLTAPPGMTAPPEGPDAASTYVQLCASCHGPDGRGETPVGRAMKVPRLKTDTTGAAHLLQVIRENPKHKAASAKIDDEGLKALSVYLLMLVGGQ